MISRGTLCALLLAALLAGRAAADDCPADRSQPLHDEARLHTDLLCGYHSDFRPVKDHKSAVNVKVRFSLKYISFDALEETFTVHAWVVLTWKDEFLTWPANNYGNIQEIQMESHEIWTPRMALFNADASQDPSDTFYTTCVVASDGTVTCVPQVAHSGICSTKLRRWPYDVQNCTMYFGTWIHTGEQINFTLFKSRPVIVDDYMDGPGWKLLKVVPDRLPGNYTALNATYPMLKYTFMLQREAAGPAAIVVVPSVVVVLLTMISLLLDVKDNVRLLLVCFSLFGHFMFLTEIGYDIPKHSSDTPIILLFVRDSMIMTITAIVLTLVLMSLRRRRVPPPAWVVSVTRLATSGPGKYAVFTEFDPSDIDKKILTEDGPSSQTTEEASRTASEWIQFCNLLNSFVFIACSFIYFILICVYIPYN